MGGWGCDRKWDQDLQRLAGEGGHDDDDDNDDDDDDNDDDDEVTTIISFSFMLVALSTKKLETKNRNLKVMVTFYFTGN